MGLLIFYAICAIFFSFLCSVLEAALLSFTPSFLKLKTSERKPYAAAITKYKQDIDRPLIAILTINTIAHTVGAILVGVQAEKVFGGGGTVGLVSALMTLAILVLSEIIPKTIGATYWDRLGDFTAKTLQLFIFPLKYTGILWLLMQCTKLIGKSARVNAISREAFLAITEAAKEEGVFEETEGNFIKNILIFKSVLAKDVMTPFSVALIEDEEVSIETFHSKHKNLKFSRIPIFKDLPNNVTGFILKDDLLEEMLLEKGSERLSSLKRPIQITSEDTPIPTLFESLLEKRSHLAIVVDEFGNTVGLVTMEDIIETLIGFEIMDESDRIEDMQAMARKHWERRARRLGIIDNKQNER